MNSLDELKKLRQEIDAIDKEIIYFFEKRMNTVLQVLEYKRKNGLPIFHKSREQEVLKKILGYLQNKDFEQEAVDLYEGIMRSSRRRQSRTLFPYNIVLIGFMGTGKSTISRHLSNLLEMEFVDTDGLIEEKAELSIPMIFEKYGEVRFRELEKEIIQELSQKKNIIISCGGGVVLNPDNVTALKSNGKIVLLSASPNTIYHRVKDSIERPLLKDKMTIEYIEGMLAQREKIYLAAAHRIIDTNNKTVEEISNEIISSLLK